MVSGVLPLAISIAEAGAYPSLDTFCSSSAMSTVDNYEYLYESLKEFKKSIGNTNIVVSSNFYSLCNKDFILVVKLILFLDVNLIYN